MIPPRPLEAFYYVAKYGGIALAQPHMHGISRQAICMHVAELEDYVGQALLARPDFGRTSAGSRLFALCPRFDQLDSEIERLRSERRGELRVGIGEAVLHNHFAPVLDKITHCQPALNVVPVPRAHAQLRNAVEDGSVDFAITMVDDLPATVQREVLLRLPWIGLVAKSTGITSAAALFRQRAAAGPLVVSTWLAELFRRALKRRRQPDWPPATTPETFSLVEWCAVHKGCVGVTLQLPGETRDPSLNVIALERFGLVSIGVIWREPASPFMPLALEALHARARELCPESPLPAPAAAAQPKPGDRKARAGRSS